MLDVLLEVKKNLRRLMRDGTVWNDIDVNYHPPRVERIWRQYGQYRIFLHRIHPCTPEEALMHGHAWPSAMFLLSGSYMMLTGKAPGLEKPAHIERMILAAGSCYEMTDLESQHAVAPLEICNTLMVSGKPTGNPAPHATKQLFQLDPLAREDQWNLWLKASESFH